MTSSSGTVSWVKNIGHMLINNVNLEIGGQEIDKQYCDWFNIWNELSISPGHKDGYADMIGNTSDLVSSVGSTDLPAKTLYVPLQFWFNRNVGLALVKHNATEYILQKLQKTLATTLNNATCTSESRTRDNLQLRGSPKIVKSDIVSPLNPHKANRTSQILEHFTMPICKKCVKDKPDDEFEWRKDSGTRRKACLECTRAQKMAIYRRKHPEQAPKPVDPRTIGVVQVCRTCDREKPLAEFNKATAGGFERQCKKCQAEYIAQYKRDLAAGTRAKLVFPVDEENGKKLCTDCDEWKPFEDFPKRNDSSQGMRHQCQSCKNKDHARWQREKFLTSEQFRLSKDLSFKTWSVVMHRSKSMLCGINSNDVRTWLEFQFGDDLSWENYPKAWTIDHVVPRAAFDLTDEDQYRM